MRVAEEARRVERVVVPETVREILFPTDLQPRARAAFAHAEMLGARFAARVTLLHVVAGPEAADTPASDAAEVARRRVREARDRLEMDAAALHPPARVLVTVGADERSGLRSCLDTTTADLVVLATHGHEGLSALNPRSVSDTVLRHARCPVVCVREPAHGAAVPWRRVLVPTDLGEHSRRALPLARLLADAFGAETIGLHVAPLPTIGRLSGIPDLVEEVVPTEERVAAFLAPVLGTERLRVVVRAGTPWPGIVEVAAREHVDAVVLSTHGHDTLADRLLGSHAERVVRESPCPVVLV